MTRAEAEARAREKGPGYGPVRCGRLPGGWCVRNVQRDAIEQRRLKGTRAEKVNGRTHLPPLVPVPEGMRYCHGCKGTRPIEEFGWYQKRGEKPYRLSLCHACDNERKRLYKQRRRAMRAPSPAQP